MLGRYAWTLDLFAHFRVQYTLLLLIVAIVLFAMRAPLLGVVAIAGAALGALPIVSYMGVQTARAEASSANFRVITFNTWFRNHDYAAIGRFLEQLAGRRDRARRTEPGRRAAARRLPLVISAFVTTSRCRTA